MLFMVIEKFKDDDVAPAGERFRSHGRMLPAGVEYHASWMTPEGSRCFQLMSAPQREALDPWMERWKDLVDFEVMAVVTSADFWAAR